MKVKRTMAAILILMLLFAMLLTACGGTKPEDVTEMYSSSSELTDSENRLVLIYQESQKFLASRPYT